MFLVKKGVFALGLVLIMSGCTNGSDPLSDEPHEAPGRTITHLTPENLDIFPEVEVIDGVTYMDGILIVNDDYGLPEDYNPGLSDEVVDAYTKMTEAGRDEGLQFVMVSGYRSYDEQETLYNDYVAREGQEEADNYSAAPGHSEHQSGLAFDIGSIESASTFEISFEDTDEYEWMKDIAHEYGFIIRYKSDKEDITGIHFEPWHLRYVGEETATEIHEKDLVLEEYLRIR